MDGSWTAIPLQIIVSFFGFSAITAVFFNYRHYFEWRKCVLWLSMVVCFLYWGNVAWILANLLDWNNGVFVATWYLSIIPIAMFWVDVGIKRSTTERGGWGTEEQIEQSRN